jgi:hypothetical protein
LETESHSKRLAVPHQLMVMFFSSMLRICIDTLAFHQLTIASQYAVQLTQTDERPILDTQLLLLLLY